jgi:hypothetical protein
MYRLMPNDILQKWEMLLVPQCSSQFSSWSIHCVLASDNPDVVDRSIEEFEYHADMARWMGYGKRYQDFKINVHIAGRAGPAGIKSALKRLSPEARNCITIENDEISWGIDASLELAKDLALVLDIHHHWIHSGEYIEAKTTVLKGLLIVGVVCGLSYITAFHGKNILLSIPDTSAPIFRPS